LSGENGGHPGAAVKAAPHANGTQGTIQALLESLCHGCAPVDKAPPAPADNALDLLYNHAALLKAQESLVLQSQDKLSLNVVFWACISAMVGILNLFLDLELPYSWREASIIVAKVQGHGLTHVCSIQMWVLDFV